MSDQPDAASELGKLADRVREIIGRLGAAEAAAASERELKDYRERMAQTPQGRRSIVLAEDTAVELGLPRCASVSAALWTDEPGRLRLTAMEVAGCLALLSLVAQRPVGMELILDREARLVNRISDFGRNPEPEGPMPAPRKSYAR